MKVSSNLDFESNEVKNVIVDPLGSPPSNPFAGRWYYDEGLSALRVWNGGEDEHTKLLLHCNVINDTSFYDSSSPVRIAVANGDARVDGVKKKFGTGSAVFDGDGDYLSLSNSDDWNLGSGDFTVDLWVRVSVYNSQWNTLVGQWKSSATADFGWVIDIDKTNNRLQFAYSTDGSSGTVVTLTGSALTWNTGTWYHIAVVRSGSVVCFFRNGSQCGSGSIGADTIYDSSLDLRVGASEDGNNINGNIDELRVSKGVARWTSNFIPPSAEYIPGEYTKLLLHCDGDDGSTSFPDSSSAHIITVHGDAQVSALQSRFGGASGLFDGTGDYLTVPNSDDWSFGADDFTIDCWLNANIVGGAYRIIAAGSNADGANNMWFLGFGNVWGGSLQKLDFGYYNGSGYTEGQSSTLVHKIGDWNHVAVVRSGETMYFFWNGQQAGTWAISTAAINCGASGLIVAARYGTDSNSVVECMNGYLDEVRISKGIARWTDSFTLSTVEYTADSYTKLLLHCDGVYSNRSFLDSSASVHVLSAHGNTQVDTVCKKLGTGSAIFDGVGYISAPASDDFRFGTGDFTVDFRIKWSGTPGVTDIMGMGGPGGGLAKWIIGYNALATGLYINWLDDMAVWSWSPLADTWYHVAIVRTGDTFKAFIDGVSLGDVSKSPDIQPVDNIGFIVGADGELWHYFNGWLDEVRVSKGIARWTSNFVPPVTEYVSDEYTMLLLHCDYVNASMSFPNSSSLVHVITAHEDAQVDITQKELGNGSVLFDGADDYLSVPDSADWDLGGGDFTIDFWMKLPDGSTGGTLVDQLGTVKAWRLRCSTTSLSFSYTTDNSTVHTLSRTISFSLNTWYHIACVRYGTVLRFFVDGMQLGEEFSVGSDVIYDSSVSLFIGAGHNSGDDSPEEFFSGRLDEVRICKGIARWTSSFVLPFIEYTYFDTNWVNTGTSSGITLPVGTVLSVFDDDVPDSYLECDGSVLSRMTYAALFAVIGTMYGNTSGSDFKLPDYRGCFLRGWDHSAGNDPDAADRTDRGDGTEGDYVGTRQEDQFRRHTHLDYATDNSQGNCALHSWTPFQLTYPSLNESSYGGNETRPLNIYCMYCIKYTT